MPNLTTNLSKVETEKRNGEITTIDYSNFSASIYFVVEEIKESYRSPKVIGFFHRRGALWMYLQIFSPNGGLKTIEKYVGEYDVNFEDNTSATFIGVNADTIGYLAAHPKGFLSPHIGRDGIKIEFTPKDGGIFAKASKGGETLELFCPPALLQEWQQHFS